MNVKTEQVHTADNILTDPVAFGRILMEVAQRTQPMVMAFLERQEGGSAEQTLDPMNLSPAYIQFFSQLWSDPKKLARLQMQYWNDWTLLWQESTKKFLGQPARTLHEPDKGDRRFKSAEWQESAFFDFVKQSYLLTGKWMDGVVKSTEGLDQETKRKVDFYTRQYINAISPTNFLLTNPDVLKETVESRGENLVRGLEHLLADMERGQGTLKISTTNYEAFEVGRNLAVTPGKVIFQNELMQLIQYEASTKQVHKTPLLVVPPWINKYYILDLKPENSMMKWLVDQGHTVFMVSWVNPGRDLAHKQFDDYMKDGLLAALEQIRVATGEPSCNVAGYCLGGTLLTMTLAWLTAQGRAGEIKSASFLTTLVDFEQSGDLQLFMDDRQLEAMEKEMAEKGYLSADALRQTFSILRANDMVWSFVVNNYLMGREPFPFDLLYWNDDATNMPAAMHSYYLRKLYRENLLAKPGGLTMNDVPIDVSAIETPCYFLSTKEDHIAPWMATYRTTQLVKGPKTFTLAASGHVAGVVNPPDKKKYCYWTSSNNPPDCNDWLAEATQQEGSWWPNWGVWLEDHAGGQVPSRKVGGGRMKTLENAPGSYVGVKSV
jgi:polyhydroxyalkanoate synthase